MALQGLNELVAPLFYVICNDGDPIERRAAQRNAAAAAARSRRRRRGSGASGDAARQVAQSLEPEPECTGGAEPGGGDGSDGAQESAAQTTSTASAPSGASVAAEQGQVQLETEAVGICVISIASVCPM